MDVLQTLKSERSKLQSELHRLDSAIKALGGMSTTTTKRPALTVAARARIAAAQRARWAKVRAKNGQNKTALPVTRKRPALSAAAKARIAAAQRARWAKIKARKSGKAA